MKKYFKLLFALIIVLFMFLPIVKVNAEEVKHVVEFRSQGGTAIENQYIVHGEKASVPYIPYKTGSNFGGWYLDIPCEEPFDFNTPILEDTYLYAKWTPAIMLDEVRLYSAAPRSVSEGPLPSYTVTTNTEHVTVKEYGNGSTWAKLNEYGGTDDFGDEPLIAIADGTTVYYMKIALDIEPGYQLGSGTEVFFNDESFYDNPSIKAAYAWTDGIYVLIEVGTAIGIEPRFNITFDYNGGSKDGLSSSTYETVAFAPYCDKDFFMKGVKSPNAKVLDYILVNGKKRTIPFELMINQDVTFKYVWKTAPKVKITFNPNGGKVTQTSKTVYQYSTYGTLPKPTRKGYTFNGWYTAKTGGTKIVASTETKNIKARILYARWGLTKYKITYNLNKGTNNKKNPATYTMKTKTFSFKNPSRKGYIFKGWYTDKKFKKKITSIKKGSTGNKTIYAKWAAISYKITYNKNGGSGSMKDTTGVKYDKNVTLRGNSFKRAGYKFTGWNTKKDGSGKTYANKAKVKNLTSKNGATVTLYAQWKKVAYIITYKLNGGTNNSSNPATYTISSTVNFKNPSKKGYSFKGWFTDSKFKKKITSIAKGSTGDKTLYAKWSKITYTIQYELNGGNYTIGTRTEYSVTDEVELIEPGKPGYVFLGWYSEPEFINKYSVLPKGTTGNKKFYAKWVEETSQTQALYSALVVLEEEPYSAYVLRIALEYDMGFSYDDATYAIENCGADWKANALKRAKMLLDKEPLSYYTLVDTLENTYHFTTEEAEDAANKCGADWDANARLKAQDIYENYAFISYDLLILELEMSYVGFTHEQAVNAANYVDSYADWYAKALQAVNEIMQYENISRHELLEIRLKNNYMFTEEQALYGIEQANIDFEKVCLESAKDHLEWWSECPEDSMISYLESQGFTSEEIEYAIEELY